jgi:F0F1-type ATP synthase membrane subunit b/b'
MRRASRFALLFCLAAGFAFAAEKEGGDNLQMWKWANFAVLAGGLGYLMVKMLPPIFAARTQAITKDMVESQKISQDAEARAADVERRLAAIETEITALRSESKAETAAEADRLAKHTAAEIARIQAQSEREISAAGLSVELAGQKIRARMTPATADRLVRGFMRELK